MTGSQWYQKGVGGLWQVKLTRMYLCPLLLSVAHSLDLARLASMRACASKYAAQARLLERMASDYLADRPIKPLSAYEALCEVGESKRSMYPSVTLLEIQVFDVNRPGRVEVVVDAGGFDPYYWLTWEDGAIVDAVGPDWSYEPPNA